MSELRAILAQTTERVLALLPDDFNAAWSEIERAGLQNVLLQEDKGGFGGGFEDAHLVFRASGRHATSLPLVETILATRLISDAELIVPDGALTISPAARGRVRSGKFTGEMRAVPFGDVTSAVAGILDERAGGATLVVAECAEGELVDTRQTIAGETRCTVQFSGAKVQAAPLRNWTAARLHRTLALLRASQIGGAIDTALDLSVTYVRERTQFGRPLAAFQAIQQQLAVLAEECAAANAAAMAGCRAADQGEAQFEIAAAKLRANIAAGVAAPIAHQVHGAMGFTDEYALSRFTTRLWSWRSEFGNDRFWADELGQRVAARGADAFWPDLVGA
jgi:acyl-CoA dehydrogenase